MDKDFTDGYIISIPVIFRSWTSSEIPQSASPCL